MNCLSRLFQRDPVLLFIAVDRCGFLPFRALWASGVVV